jgi:hypothetical protein
MKFWRSTVKESHKIIDPIKRAKNQTSRLINFQLSKLSSITRQASLEFPALRNLHPFERVRENAFLLLVLYKLKSNEFYRKL